MKNYILCCISLLIIKICSTQNVITVFSKKLVLKADDKLICSYGQNEDSTFSYLKINNDSIFIHILDKKNGKYSDWSYCSASLASIDPVLSRVLDVGLNETVTKAGIIQLITHDYQESISYHMINEKRDTFVNAPSANLICCSLNDAIFWRWKIARLINPAIPNRKVWIKKDTFSVPVIPLFYSREKNRYGEFHTYHRYYEIKNDSLFCYAVYDLDEWSGECGYISIEKVPLSSISKTNMVVRKVGSNEYSEGPERDSYAVAVGTLGKFIVTDYYNNGKDKSEIQKAIMLIICANKEMADAVFNEILKAQKKN